MEAKKLAVTILSVSCKTLLFVLVILFLFIVGDYMYKFGQKVFNEKAMSYPENAVAVKITIPPGASAMDVAEILVDNGLAENKVLFFTQSLILDCYDEFVSGTYILRTDMKPSQIMAVIAPEQEENTEE